MKIQKALRFSYFLLIPIFLGASRSQATPEQDFSNQAQADYQTMNDYVNGQFAKSMGFITSLGWNTPAEVFDILSGPHVEVGIGAGADLLSMPNLNSLNLGAIDLGSNFSLPSHVPFPFPVITGRIGLVNGLDVGMKYNYLPLVSLPQLGFAANYFGWGLDLRYKILEGAALPNLTVGISFDSMRGSFSLTTGINQTSTYNDPGLGSYPNTTFTGSNLYTLNWDTKSFGAQLQIGKNLGAAFPFAAVGFQRNSGTVTSLMSGSGQLNVTGTPTNLSVNAVSTTQPVSFEPKFVVGIDFGGGLHWAVVGESNGTDIAGSTSFRVSF